MSDIQTIEQMMDDAVRRGSDELQACIDEVGLNMSEAVDLRDELTEWQHRYFRGFYSPGYYAFRHEWSGTMVTLKQGTRARSWWDRWRIYITLGKGW